MAFKTYLLIGGLLLFCNGVNYAQLRIPQFDVEVKGQQNIIPGAGKNDGDLLLLETTNIYAGAHVQLNQHIALGGFYSRSFRGNVRFSDGQDRSVPHNVLLLQKGLDIRFSTGRAKKRRPHLSLNYSQVELVQVTEAFRLAGKTNAFGANLGIMRKLGNKLYLVGEFGVKVMLDEIFWFNTSNKVIFDYKLGLTYNIGKKK